MFSSYKTLITNISKGADQSFETVIKGTEKVKDNMSKGFEKMSEAFEYIGDGMEDIFKDLGSSTQSNGDTTITNNHGHVVIEGKVKSLKVNGVDFKV